MQDRKKSSVCIRKKNNVCMSKKKAMSEKKLRLENVAVQGSNPALFTYNAKPQI
jgi:hypothetical protein